MKYLILSSVFLLFSFTSSIEDVKVTSVNKTAVQLNKTDLEESINELIQSNEGYSNDVCDLMRTSMRHANYNNYLEILRAGQFSSLAFFAADAYLQEADANADSVHRLCKGFQRNVIAPN